MSAGLELLEEIQTSEKSRRARLHRLCMDVDDEEIELDEREVNGGDRGRDLVGVK